MAGLLDDVGAGAGLLYKKHVPANARTLLESLLGNKDKITERDFTAEELSVLRELAKKNKENVSYFDYPRDGQRGGGFIFDSPIDAAVSSYKDPAYSMMGTLGSFNLTQDEKNIYAKDRYNFDNKAHYKMTGNEDLPEMLRRAWQYRTSPAGMIDQLLIRYGKGIDRDVDITIPK